MQRKKRLSHLSTNLRLTNPAPGELTKQLFHLVVCHRLTLRSIRYLARLTWLTNPETINAKTHFYTTSSCAGRTIIVNSFQDADKNKKYNIGWVYLTHDMADSNEAWTAIENELHKPQTPRAKSGAEETEVPGMFFVVFVVHEGNGSVSNKVTSRG
jgi:hypothetical protein